LTYDLDVQFELEISKLNLNEISEHVTHSYVNNTIRAR